MAAGRLSYVFGLSGPSVAVDTACSSSLVAVGQAHNALMLGAVPACLAGGVNLLLSPHTHAMYAVAGKPHVGLVDLPASQLLHTAVRDNSLLDASPCTPAPNSRWGLMIQHGAGMLAADGRCKTLDAAADGYVRSEACAALQLRVVHSLGGEPQAPPHLLVLGTAVNQDGRSSSLTAPSGPAQQALLKTALASASLPPSQVPPLLPLPAACPAPAPCCAVVQHARPAKLTAPATSQDGLVCAYACIPSWLSRRWC